MLATLGQVLAQKQEVTGATMRTMLLGMRHFDGLLPLDFKTNTASAEVDILRIDGGHETVVTRGVSE